MFPLERNKMKSYAFTTFVVFFFFFSFCVCCSWCFVYGQAVSEKYVLLDFKASVDDPHGLLSGWDIQNNSNHCSWPGVTCNTESRVVSINIAGAIADGYPGNFRAFSCSKSLRFPFHDLGGRRACSSRGGKLRGKLLPLIAELSGLRVLSLPFHQLSGEIPPEIWDLDGLRVLNLEGNLFSGKLPTSFLGLRRLRVLNLGFNMLDGDIPASLFRCVALEILNLSGNKLKGPIPGLFDSLVKLRGLYLANNELNGTVPSVLGHDCRNLENLDLSGNFLIGKIPATLGNCRHLRTLLLFSNLLNDSIPHELGRLRKLEVLDISRNFINGVIPSELGKCTQLSILVLSSLFEPWPYKRKSSVAFSGVSDGEYNHFQGSIPTEVTSLPKLRVFWAPGASLEGKLPGNWGDCERLEMLNLAHNGFSGEINGVFERCKKLYYLDLSSNELSGDLGAKHPVPSNLVSDLFPRLDISFFRIAPSLNSEKFAAILLNNHNLSEQIPSGSSDVASSSPVDASLNDLSGQFPLNRKALTFSSSVGKPFLYRFRRVLLPASPSDQTSSPPESKAGNHGFNAIEIASIASASAIVSVLLALIVLFFYTRTMTPDARVQVVEPKEISVFVDIGVPLSYENIVQATGNFNASNCIGNGGFGATYKAEISPGSLLAIKRLAVGRFQGVQQFHAEIKALGTVSHPNLVTLIGYHASEAEMFLIYNYLPGGNLEDFIKERSSRTVDWKIFHKIALDVARALAYLHDQCNPRILHRDVKPSNILLDNDYNAYLSDFGLSRLLGTSETHATTGVAGTFGYVAPEYAMTCRVSEKADVYSYGVVLLELLSDKKALDPSFCAHENGFNIVSWACMLLRRGRAKEVFTARLWESGPHDDMVEVLHLAVTCTVETLSTRPTMKQVVQRLKRIQPS